jgi:hypothetical protein
MKEKAKKYGEAIVNRYLMRGYFAMAYNSCCYLASMGCEMVATSLSMEEYKDIKKPPVNAILLKMGIYHNMARHVVFCKTKYGGLGLAHLAAVQGYGQLQYLLGDLRSEDTPGTLYSIIMEFTRLE